MDKPLPHASATPALEALMARHYPHCEPIAVIGLACRFPEADDSEAFWRNLLEGRDCSRRFSRQELLDAGLDAATIDAPHFVNAGAPLRNADMFDADLFAYSRQEVESMDPQQRLFLQTVWHALEHAGYAPRDVPHKTAVYGSARISTYPGREPIHVTEVGQGKNLQSLIGNDKDYVATRVAYKLNLRGPALSVQTACSSSLVAVHLACESLRASESDMAVAGGVAVSFPQQAGYLHQPGMIFSPDGRCRPFDINAQGTFAGNGVGVVALRRLEDALRDGDPIVAVLRGSAVNSDGHQKVGFTAPSVLGQREVVREAMLFADIDSTQLGLIEAHGTATPLGDPIELEALRGAFHRRDDGPRCALGSVKSNLGHLDTAAGIASLLKAVLAVERGMIPPSLHFQQANPALGLENSPFYVPVDAQPWTAAERIAGVSSFGIGGTNCHVIVAALPAELRASAAHAAVPEAGSALLLSAASEHALKQLAGAYAEALQRQPPDDLAHTALHGRHLDLPCRLAMPLCAETAHALAAYATGEDDSMLLRGQGDAGKQAWVFTGQGAHWPGMGKTMYQHSPAFASCLDRCSAACGDRLDPPLRDALLDDHTALLERMAYAQPAIVAFELAMAAHWQALGLKPDMVFGHSVGEYAAAVVAGHYEIEQIMPLMQRRGELMQSCAGGAMLAAFAEEATLLPLATELGLDLAAYNGERHLVFSGPQAAIDALATTLATRDIHHSRLSVAGAAHSSLLDGVLAAYQRETAQLSAAPGRLPLISTLLGDAVHADRLNAPDYWRRHMREPVRYVQALRTALALGAKVVLELGPDAPLTGIGQRLAPDAAQWIASARRHQPAMAQTRQALLQLYVAGIDLPWKTLLPGNGRKIHAPLYPFDTQRYWREAEPRAVALASVDEALAAGRRVAANAANVLDLPRLQALYDCVTQLHAVYVDVLVRRCLGERFEQGASALAILRAGRLLPRHRQLLIRLLNGCVEDGYYRRDGACYFPARAAPHPQRDALLQELRGYCEGLDVIVDTLARAGDNLYAMMCGQIEPVAVIFPEGATSGVEVLYQEFSFGRYFNQIAAGVVAGLMRERQATGRERHPFRILEVGGGTGGTTAWLLPEVAAAPNVRYDFTDISPIFVRRAEQKFAAYPFIEYRQLDLQKDAIAQGFEAQRYDLIVAANVIHATQHIGRTLDNVRPLLKRGGRLLMREITRPMRLFDFVFGPLVLPLHDEEARGGELFLSTAHWREQCLAAGFARVDWLPDDGTATAQISEHILLASVPGHAASAPLPWDAEEDDTLLGHALTDDGCYLVDWTDCAGQHERWLERLRLAFAELSRRHGDGRIATPTAISTTAPAWLSRVRLCWQGRPFGAAHIAVSGCDDQGVWQSLTATATDAILPEPLSAPGTHYDWHWRPTEQAATPAGSFALLDAPAAMARALEEAGGTVAQQGARLLLALDPLAAAPHAVAAPLLSALADDTRRPLIVVTRSAWSIRADDPVNAAHRAAWGLLRVAAIEQPERAIAAIDLAANAAWSALRPGLAAIDAGSRWIAVRDGQAQAPHLAVQQHAAPGLPAHSLHGDGWHLVTGAFGGLGRVSVHWLARQGARRIALLAPRAHADWPDFERTVTERYGCQLRWLPCDVADAAQLAAALHTLHDDGGIAGAIHAAGLLDDMPLATLDGARLDAVLGVKATAARQLRDWLRAHQGRYLLLYSSAAAALGAPGQGAHALASAYLDGLAQENGYATAPTVLSIAWGAWGETGRAADQAMQEKLAAGGMGTLTSAEGLWHLEQAVMRGAPYRLAMRVLPARLDRARRALFRDSTTAAAGAATSRQDALPIAADPVLGHGGDDLAAIAAWLNARIAAQLRLDDITRLTPERDLLQLGLDSLLFLELSSDIQRQFGLRVNAEQAYRDLTVSGLSRLIAAALPHAETAAAPAALRHDAANRFAPFPLTPIQHAYWLGRTDLIEYGGVACHVVFEWDKRHDQFDLQRFESAWNALIQRHDMLRMVVDADGLQRILPQVPAYRLPRRDLRSLTPAARERALADIRHALCYRVLPADRWPLFELAVSECDDQHYRLHMNLDLLQFDVQSFKVMMDDLASAYRGQTLPPLTLTFRDYVMAEQAQRSEPGWRDAWRYWQETLPHLPPAPRLPLAPASAHSQPRFTTYQARLERSDWETLKQTWRAWGVTPSAALLALFARTLERWSRHPEFTLNLTFFSRRQDHPQVAQLIGDFTSVLLIDFALGQPQTLRDTIEHTQQRLWQRLAHSQINGVELLRELGRGHRSNQPLMPIVFTSMLGMSLDGLTIDQAMTHLLGDPAYVFTQTPQVWLDHQVMEIDGALVFNWYCMDDVLPAGTAQAMFDDYRAVLRSVVAQPDRMTEPALSRQQQDGTLEAFPRRSWPAREGDAASLDLGVVETLLRAHQHIRHAETALSADGVTLDVTLVAADQRPPITTVGALPCDTAALPALTETQRQDVDACWHWLEARALHGIAATLRRHGLFAHEGQRHEGNAVYTQLRALPKYHGLVHQWLSGLCERGWLRREGTAFVCMQPLAQVPEPTGPLPQADWSRTLCTYLDKCIARHDALLDGTQSPLELFFGEGNEAVTRSLYSDNPVVDCLHRSAAQIVRALCENTADLQVLEVGAGIAATTRHLLPALEGRLQGYRFTDVSTLFLDDARQLFADVPQLDYALFDINQPVDFDAHPHTGYDLIVAANVLHDAAHVVHTLRRLAGLLKAGGRLLVIEATERDSMLQMASVGFIESLNSYQDLRTADNKPMLDLPMWRDVLEQAGFTIELTWPEQEHTPMRQHLIVARAERIARLDPVEVAQWLREQFDGTLPPLRIRQHERLDMAHAPAKTATPSSEAPLTAPAKRLYAVSDADNHALEQRVLTLWQGLLRQPLHRDSDFFQCGGDSLIATRMIAQLNRQGLRGASLQHLFAHPTLAAFCSTLAAPVSVGASNPLLLATGADPALLFVFHASDGAVSAYLPLAQQLDMQVFGLQADDALQASTLSALAENYVAAIRGRQAHGPYLLLGWSYGTFVAAEAARLLHAGGETVELVLLDPVCRADFHCADRVALLRLLAQGRIAVPLPDDLAQYDPDAQTTCFMRNAAAAGVLPAAPALPQANDWLHRIDHLLALLVSHPAPAPLPIPCLWLRAARRPAHWRPAELDWQDWAPHAQQHTLDADHWQLVMENPQAQRTAARILQWRHNRRPKESA